MTDGQSESGSSRAPSLEAVLGRITISTALVLFGLVLGFELVTHPHHLFELEGLAFHILPLVAVLGCLLVVLRLPTRKRTNIALCLIAIAVAVYLAELGLVAEKSLRASREPTFPECGAPTEPGLLFKNSRNCNLALREGLPFDSRSMLEVLQEADELDRELWPLVAPYSHLARKDIGTRPTALLPLAGVANVPTLMCNESGAWVSYHSDERGFRNPMGLHSQPVSVALVGDSFAQGYCVGAEHEPGALIRKRYPRTLNLGVIGNGPLFELATIKEYLRPLRPSLVLWFFYHNDTSNLEAEKTSEILVRYLDGTYVQDLALKQDLVDLQLEEGIRISRRKATADRSTDAPRSAPSTSWRKRPLTRFLLATKLRYRLLGLIEQEESPRTRTFEVDLLQHVLAVAKSTVESWGGDLYFVYLPAWVAFSPSSNDFTHRDLVFEVVNGLEIPIIDTQAAFATHDDPLSLFPFRRYGHYTPEGYRLITGTILDSLPREIPPQKTAR